MPHGGEVGESQVVIDDHRHCKQQQQVTVRNCKQQQQITAINGSQIQGTSQVMSGQ